MRRPARWLPLVWLLLSGISGGCYLWLSERTYGLGFPLDDAWIHQTYARNLAQLGEWAFVPGTPSAGSTGPLWSTALAPSYWLGIEARVWTYALGLALLAGTAWVCSRWIALRQPEPRSWPLAAAGLVLFEWHLVWAAVSGMETLALAFMSVLVLCLLEEVDIRPIALGLLIGAAVWLRPDALLLTAPALLAGAWAKAHARVRLRHAGELLAGCAVLLLPYLAFNRGLSGEWWPTTFFAKQAEYAVLRQAPFVSRVMEQLALPLVGAGALLAMGAAVGAWKAAASRRWSRLVPLAWVVAHLGAYAWRLPVIYQHGRYAIPVLPVLIVLGIDGWAEVVDLRSSRSLPRVLSRVWAGALAVVAAVFWIRGARAYAAEVAFIETEMVTAARWVAENTPEDALVAAHDIGALGYFADRRLVDLAGLISPEVIPILRDEAALRSYLNAQGAAYLVTFPGWYPSLTAGASPLFATSGAFSPAAGGENMAVYPWPTPVSPSSDGESARRSGEAPREVEARPARPGGT